MKKTPKDPMVAALQGKLQGILAKPMTAKTLLDLERTARLARELLMVGNANVMASGMKSSLTGLSFVGAPGYDTEEGPMYPNPIASSPLAETFGSAAIRELVLAAKDMMKPAEAPLPPYEPTLCERVMAIGQAKDAGLIELAAKLEATLIELLPAPIPKKPKSETLVMNGKAATS